MTFGIIKERKNPPDRRVVFSPQDLIKIKNKYPDFNIKIEQSDNRIFSNLDYQNAGFEVVDTLENCDVIFGVKEIPVESLIPNKSYFFFSHTIKKQPYNKKLLQTILEKNITLYDHETIVDNTNRRLIGFGRYAGIVGTYNGIRGFGIKYELFNIPKASDLKDYQDLIKSIKRFPLPPIKIVLTGMGKVGMGAKEMLDVAKIKKVNVEDFFTKNYTQAVYTQIDVLDYNKRNDGKIIDNQDFYKNPEQYISDFEKYTKVADMFIAGHFYDNKAPKILTKEMLNAPDNKIQVVADISCDVNGPIVCTLRASTIADPFFGYLPASNEEVSYKHPASIMVMSVDNLPCELPKDASEGFGEMFIEHVIPAFFNEDKDGILERAKITENGKLTHRFSYLEDYLNS